MFAALVMCAQLLDELGTGIIQQNRPESTVPLPARLPMSQVTTTALCSLVYSTRCTSKRSLQYSRLLLALLI